MKLLLLSLPLLLLPACSGADAPRPIAPSSTEDHSTSVPIETDDDNDGIANEHDRCPMARGDEADDGCPASAVADAGV